MSIEEEVSENLVFVVEKDGIYLGHLEDDTVQVVSQRFSRMEEAMTEREKRQKKK